MSYKLLKDLSNNQVTQSSQPCSMGVNKTVSIHAVYSDLTPSSKSFLDSDVTVAADTIGITSHGFINGVMGQFTTTGTLPAGLSLSTNYFIIKIDDNTIKVATSYNNALVGTAVDITGATGTGTHTFTPTVLNVTLKVQASADNGENWQDISGKSVTISSSGNTILNLVDFSEPLFRCVLTQTDGQGLLNLKVHTHIKK
jgi:hypothetical protein